ncbi:MAG: hypothetical protein DRI73_02385 [Bacteroidetes bacterium]|nr:MAG: hypothetical protein DRI73_02385 [Bacteroidota bacterium]
MKQIPTKTFKKYLRFLGLVHTGTKGSHEKWDRKDNSLDRPVILRGNKKEIPLHHIHTNLFSLGLTHDDFEKWLNGNKKK